jgi:hypothetical protein
MDFLLGGMFIGATWFLWPWVMLAEAVEKRHAARERQNRTEAD